MTLQVDILQINPETIQEISDLLRNFKGDKPLMVDVFHSDEKIKLTLPSRKRKIKVTHEFLERLDEASIHYKLN